MCDEVEIPVDNSDPFTGKVAVVGKAVRIERFTNVGYAQTVDIKIDTGCFQDYYGTPLQVH